MIMETKNRTFKSLETFIKNSSHFYFHKLMLIQNLFFLFKDLDNF